MKNYYAVFGLSDFVSVEEIKRAFREKIKSVHPDFGNSHQNILYDLLEAYSVLGSKEKKAFYDQSLTEYVQTQKNVWDEFDYRHFLQRRLSHPLYRFRLILYDLFHEQDEEAILLFESFENNLQSMEYYLSYSDFMDALYLLGEAFEKLGFFEKALRMMILVLEKEQEKTYFRYFSLEIIEKIQYLSNKVFSDSSQEVIFFSENQRSRFEEKIGKKQIQEFLKDFGKNEKRECLGFDWGNEDISGSGC